MKWTVEIGDDLIEQAVKRAAGEAVAGLLKNPAYSYERGGEAYERIKEAVRDHLAMLDLTAVIERIARDRVEVVAAEVLDSVLRSAMKKKASEMIRDGSLFPSVK